MLEDLRPGDAALLVDVTDKDDRDPTRFGERNKPRGGLLDLRDAAGRGGRGVAVDSLDRVGDHDLRRKRFDLLQDPTHVGLGLDKQFGVIHAETVGPHLELAGRFLSREVEDSLARRRQLAAKLHQKRRLTDPGLARKQQHRAADDPAAENAVQFVTAGHKPHINRRFPFA